MFPLPKPFFDHPMLLGAHRGGVMEVPENTELAFRITGARYPFMVLETDVRLTKDGQLVLLHDETVDRTTNGHGKLADLTLAEARRLDAGYRFTIDGKTYPFRGKGVRLTTLEEAMRAAPESRYEIDIKSKEVAEKVAAVVTRLRATDRVLLASFVPAAMARARELLPTAATCYDFNNGARLLAALRGPKWDAYQPEADVLSMMKEQVEQFRLTPDEITRVRAKGIRFQIHTLDTSVEIRKWLRAGVDSILTDQPDTLVAMTMGPLRNAHAHNDYAHSRPLQDALDQGFGSIEADIFLEGGELRVGHNRSDLRPGRTLESLYLEPLWRRFQTRQRALRSAGVVDRRAPIQLLVDIKEDGEAVYRELKRHLRRYQPMLTRLDKGVVSYGDVTIVLSGSRPTQSLPNEKRRWMFLDGRSADTADLQVPTVSPLTSDSFAPEFNWRGTQPMPEEMRQRLRARVQAAHRQGQKIRFWGVPDTHLAWKEMADAGMDYINTDRLADLADWLRANQPDPSLGP